MNRYYLDNNATTKLLPEVRELLIENIDLFANPSSVHFEGQKAKSIMEKSRSDIAEIFACKPPNIIFTSGASESAATLLNYNYQIGRNDINIGKFYIGSTEHACIYNGGQATPQDISYIKVNSSGVIIEEDLEYQLAQHNLDKGLPLVAIQSANSETGVLQDLEKLSSIVHKYKGIFIVDIVQHLGKAAFAFKAKYADFYIISGHKIGAPKGIGAIIANSDIMAPKPLFRGSQERGIRGGTQSPIACQALALAIKKAAKNSLNPDFINHLSSLRDFLEDKLINLNYGCVIYGKDVPRIANTSLFNFPTIEAQNLQMALDVEGFATSAGSACSSGKPGYSHVLEAMQHPDQSALRVSLSQENTKHDVVAFIKACKTILER